MESWNTYQKNFQIEKLWLISRGLCLRKYLWQERIKKINKFVYAALDKGKGELSDDYTMISLEVKKS